MLTIDKQSGARAADDGGVANDTAAAVDSISIPLGGKEKSAAKDGSSTNRPLPGRPLYLLELTHPQTHTAEYSSKRDGAVNMAWTPTGQ